MISWSSVLGGGLHAHHHGFLADIEMAEAADQAHAVKLAGPLLEAADQQHVGIEFLEGFGIAASSVSERIFLVFRCVLRGRSCVRALYLARSAGRDCGFGKAARLGKRL